MAGAPNEHSLPAPEGNKALGEILVQHQVALLKLGLEALLERESMEKEWDYREWTRRFEISRHESMPLIRRLDPESAKSMNQLEYGDHTHMEVAAFSAASIIGGTLRAAEIQGPVIAAGPSLSIGVSVTNQITLQVALTEVEVLRANAQHAGANEETLRQIDEFRKALPQEDTPSLLKRAADLATKLQPFVGLAAQVIKILQGAPGG